MKDRSLEIGKFVHDSMVAFGEDVNTQRQLPLYHDGLKPVYRRAIYTMLSQGTNMAKTATIVGKMIGTVHPHGDCIHGDTKIYTLDGKLTAVKDLVGSGPLEVLSVNDKDGTVHRALLTNVRVGQYATKEYLITFNNKYTIRVTGNHPFLTIPRLEFSEPLMRTIKPILKWKKAEDLVIGDIINSGKLDGSYDKVDSTALEVVITDIIVNDIPSTPYYDFTVEGYENAMIPLTDDLDNLLLITLHNSSCEQPVSNLVRWGIATGQGNHGSKMLIGEDAERSAPRYTEARVSDKYLNIFKDFMSYVPYDPAELPGFEEPRYLPTPVPLCLTFGSLGIGIGVNSRIPAFTVTSMMNALMNNDPQLLEAPFGLKIIKEESELDALWTIGIGKITYSYNVYQADSEGGYGTYVEGEAELFRPRLEVFNDYIGLGRVFINDETDETGTRVFIGRNYNVKGISYDQIYDMAVRASKQTKTYRLTVTDGKKVFLIPLKDWLSQTYDNYLKVIERYKVDKIAKYEFDYKVFDNLPRVAEYQFNNRDAEDVNIAEALGIELEVVSAILSKNLRTLRNADSGTKKLEAINEKLDHFRNLRPQDKVKEIINEF